MLSVAPDKIVAFVATVDDFRGDLLSNLRRAVILGRWLPVVSDAAVVVVNRAAVDCDSHFAPWIAAAIAFRTSAPQRF